MKVIIVGAGIGGLTTALSLFEAGIESRIFEAASAVAGLGLGINLQPIAVRELAELGLADKLAAAAAPIEELAFYNRHGQRIWSEPRGLAGGFHWPQYAINRGALQALLHEALRARGGEATVVTGHALVDFEQDATGVTAHFVDSKSGRRSHSERGDVLIGADGLHSVVRERFYPRQALTFAGQMMWRSSLPVPPYLGGRTMIMAGHRNQKFVAYPMSPLADGNVVLNWIAELGTTGEASPREEWNRRVDKALFADRFRTWKFDWLDIPSIIDRAQAIFEFPKVDRDPVSRWTFGRVTLLGDAAHPMQPVGSQAGSQAIVDARAVACRLAKGDPVGALTQYESERLPLMRAIALQNRAMGAEAMLELAEERAPDGFSDINDVLPQAEREERSAAYSRAAGLNVESVNACSPYSP